MVILSCRAPAKINGSARKSEACPFKEDGRAKPVWGSDYVCIKNSGTETGLFKILKMLYLPEESALAIR